MVQLWTWTLRGKRRRRGVDAEYCAANAQCYSSVCGLQEQMQTKDEEKREAGGKRAHCWVSREERKEMRCGVPTGCAWLGGAELEARQETEFTRQDAE